MINNRREMSSGILLTGFFLAALLLLAGCAPDITETDFYNRHPDPSTSGPTEIVLLDHRDTQGSIKLISDAPLHWGPNTIQVQTSGSVSNVELAVVLDTGSDLISSPIPSVQSDTEVVVFVTPPSETNGSWQLELSYATNQGQFSILQPVTIEEDIWVQHVENTSLFVSWIAPLSPQAGTERLEFAVHRFDGHAFIPVPDAILDLYPYMDMGAGDGHSAPYEAPTYQGQGRYVGSVNFIMSGGWDLTVRLGSNPTSSQSVVFKGFTVR